MKNQQTPSVKLPANNETTTKSETKIWVQFLFAAFVLIGYTIFLYFLVIKAQSEDEKIWTRFIYLFSGVEAIVFSAVGFIFGREVNRTRAEKSENEAKDAQNQEKEAKIKENEAKVKGESLAKLVLSKVDNPKAPSSKFKIRAMSAGKEENEILDLAMYVKTLYPELED